MSSAVKTGTRSLATSPRLLIPVAGFLVLLGAYAVSRRLQAEVTVSPKGEPAQVESERIAALERKLETLQLTAVMAHNRASDAPSDTRAEATIAAPEEAPARTAEEKRALEDEDRRREQAARQEFLQGLSDRVDTEPLDPGWAVATERSISNIFTERLGAEVTIESVKCASSLCRLTLSHPGEDKLSGAAWSQFALDRGDLESMAMQFDRSRARATTIYLQRGRQGVESQETEVN